MIRHIKNSYGWYIALLIYLLSAGINYRYVQEMYGKQGFRHGENTTAADVIITVAPVINTIAAPVAVYCRCVGSGPYKDGRRLTFDAFFHIQP